MGRVRLSSNIPRDTWLVIALLALVMALAFFLRVYWAIGPSLKYGYAVSGGSDSYYHERIITYILDAKHHLLKDPMLNYPVGVNNPRPPMFHWAIVLSSYIFRPFLDATHAALLMLILFPAIWGTLTIIPLYLLGKEAFNRKVGLIAAFILAIMPAHLMRSVATQADWDAFDLFFIVLMFYFFLKALKSVRYREWIKNWRDVGEVKRGIREFLGENQRALIYAALAGASLGSVALAWKGYTYAEAILFVYIFFQLFANRFRNKSNLHMIFLVVIFTFVAFTMAAPWYIATHRTGKWFEVPLLLMLALIILGSYFELTKKYPWPFVFLVGGAGIGVALALINIFMPDVWITLVSGQGYFVKSKLYSTIAEAQPAGLGTLAMSFSPGIFLLTFFGIAYILYLVKKYREEYYFFFIVYSIVAIYMAISAARFIFNAAPAFALTSAIAILWILEKLKIKEAVKEFGKYKGQFKKNFRKTVNFTRAVGVIVIAILVILPAVWSGVDAGIPYETKEKFDKQVYGILPSIMKPNKTTYQRYSPWYFGGFGYSLPKPEYPWSRAWDWLSQQDNTTPPEDRPAFVSWWDYGFEAVQRGEHPAVADNFQNGYQVAAQIITAQNESEVIALFIARLLDGVYASQGNKLSPEVMNLLEKYLGDERAKKIEDVMKDPEKYREEVLSNPSYYGKYASDISSVNTKYVMIKGIIAHMPENRIVGLYDFLRNITSRDIRYFAIDYRLFPFSGRNTGIFYAPAKLGDRRIEEHGGSVVPYDFYELKAVDEYGQEYDLDKVPMNARIVGYRIFYKPMFFHSMLYRTFIGYSGLDIGKGPDIPGFSQNLSSYQPMQAWNMTHFKLVYRTAYWNPYKDYQNHSDAWKPIPIDLALKYGKEGKGTVDLYPPAYRVLPNDVVIVKFYEGAIIEGKVELSNGVPLKHVRITLFDEYGIPHTTTFTDDNGYYSLSAVAGNLTLIVSTDGDLNKLRLVEKTILAQIQVDVSEEQAMRLKPDFVIHRDIEIKPSNLNGVVYFDVDHDKKLTSKDVRVSNATLILWNDTYHFRREVSVDNGSYSILNIPPHTYNIGLIIHGKEFDKVDTVTLNAGDNRSKDVILQPSYIKGSVSYSTGAPAPNATVEAIGSKARYVFHTNSTGEFEQLVVPGNYTLVAHLGNNYSSGYSVSIENWNQSAMEEITIKKAYLVEGKVLYHGSPPMDAIIKIKSEQVPHTVYLSTVGKDGSFSYHLPAGIYSIYILYPTSHGKATYFDVWELNESMRMNIELKDAYVFSGQIKDAKNYTSVEISIFQGDKFLRIYANNTGYFESYLPAGNYQVGFFAYDNHNHPYFGRSTLKLMDDIETTIILHPTVNITGYVFYDANGNGEREKNETMTDGLILLRDDKGYFEVRNIPPNGNFHVASTSNFEIKALVYGYKETKVIKGEEYLIQVSPKMVIVTGHIYLEGKMNNIPITLEFQSSNYTKKVENVTSSYRVELPPGDYTLRIIAGNRICESTYSLSLYEDEGKVRKDINYRAYARVKVMTQANELHWYKDGKEIATGKDVKLPLGKYLLYAKSGNEVRIKIVDVYENTVFSLSLEEGHWVSIVQENVSSYMPVNIIYSGLSFVWEYRSILLPAGDYIFMVNDTKLINGVYYHYFGERSAHISEATSISLYIVRNKIMSHWSGRAIAEGIEVSNAVIQLIALESGKKNITFSTDSAGRFDVEITPGRYMVYSWYLLGEKKYAYLTNITLYSGELERDIVYSKGYVVMGSLYLKEEKVSLAIKIQSSYGAMKITTDGSYMLILPSGEYAFESRTQMDEYGLRINYSARKSIAVKGDTYMDLVLQRNSIHMVNMNVLAADKVAVPGGEIHALVKLKNSGNDRESIKLESFSGWSIVNGETYTLNPGESEVVALTLKVPEARAGNVTVHIRARYGDVSDAYFTVYVEKQYNSKFGYEVEEWNENALVYNLTIKNDGNGEVKYRVYVLNSEELRVKGWDVELLVNGKQTNVTSVKSHESGNIKIKLIPIKSSPGLSSPLKLEIFEDKNIHILSIPLQSTHVSMNEVYIKANDVSNYTEFRVPEEWYGLWIASVGMLVALLLLWRKRK